MIPTKPINEEKNKIKDSTEESLELEGVKRVNSTRRRNTKYYLRAARLKRINKLGTCSVTKSSKNVLTEAESFQKLLKQELPESVKNLDANSLSQIAKNHLRKIALLQESWETEQPDIEATFINFFNISPNISSRDLLKNSHYAASSAEAIHKDWQKIGNDLWQSCAKIKDEYE